MKNNADLWGQTLYSGDLDRKKFFGLKTPFNLTYLTLPYLNLTKIKLNEIKLNIT